MNDSEHTGDDTSRFGIQFVILTAMFYVVIIIASLLGNITVCAVILRTKSLRRSVNSHFILSLAVSDLVTTCLVMPFELELIFSSGAWRHGEIMCNVWTTTYLLAVPTSILSLLALTVYRYRLLQDPLDIYKVSPLMTRRRATLVICVLWVYSMLFALVPVFAWKTYPRSVIGGYCYFNISRTYSVLSSLVNFVTPVITASLLNCRMYCLALRLTRSTLQDDHRRGKSQPSSNTSNQNVPFSEPEDTETTLKPKPQHEDLRKLQKRNTRAAKTTFLIVFSFIVCWLPQTLLSITGSFCRVCHMKVPHQVHSIFLMMGYLNSSINPILYSFRSPEFTKAVKQILGKRFVLSSEQSGRKTSHPWLSVTKTTSEDRETRL